MSVDSGSWDEVATFYRDLSYRHPQFAGLRDFVSRLAVSGYASGLHPWTSMHELCISQVRSTERHAQPHLRIAARGGMLEFCYVDTSILDRQWARTVSAESGYDRFSTFLDELNWFGRARLDKDT